MFWDEAFNEKGTAFWIEPYREPVERHFPYGLPHSRHIIDVVGDLVIGDQEVAIVVVLQLHPILERATVMPKMQGPGGPNSCQYALLALRHKCHSKPKGLLHEAH